MDSTGENLTHLPMVFDGSRCSAPSLCENVEPDDEQVIVPVHEFTKYVRNWKYSELLDTAVGYVCENGRKRRHKVPDNMRINKRFRMEEACKGSALRLPMRDQPDQYYDCTQMAVLSCPAGEHFDGEGCTRTPEDAFKYQGVPLFKFEPLNLESWIAPFDYKKPPFNDQNCHDPESVYLKLYDICSHPDCVNYAFLSMIPDLGMLLPDGRSKCQFYAAESRLKKEPANYPHVRFWDQRILRGPDNLNIPCTPGQKLKTGHFVWDSTVYATCEESQPFVFCPSVHTREIIPVAEKTYACKPPPTNILEFKQTNAFVPFVQNEVRSILPIAWDGTQGFKRNKGIHQFEPLPQDGYTLGPKERLTLEVNKPVNLQLRYRVTYPPNVVFEYDEQNKMEITVAVKENGFLVRNDGYTQKQLAFPTYESRGFVSDFGTQYLP